MEPLQYDTLFSYLTNGKFPSNVSRKNDKDTLRRKAKHFAIKNDVMYFKHQKNNKECQVCLHMDFLPRVDVDKHWKSS